MKTFLNLLLILSLPACGASAASAQDLESSRPNVLLILVDDLKPLLGCYGATEAHTPHIDAFAETALRFDAAYCNQAVCAPSRFTLMLGSHSTSTGLYGLGSQLRELIPDAVTLPQHFAAHGYRTESLGKVFHIGHGNEGDPQSFTVPHFHDKVIEYLEPDSTDGGRLTREEALFTNQELGNIRNLPRGAAFESPVVDDQAYADGRVAAEAVRRLQAAKQRRVTENTPFFMAVGFVRPHLPFSAPQSYWDLYDPAQLPQPVNESFPENAPPVAVKRGGEITAYKPVPEDGDVGQELQRQLIHGYYASTSYVDAQVGKVLDALNTLELSDNTIVVLWGDHGFHLGDLGIWTKHTNFEQATRIPILIRAPGVVRPGSATAQLAESVDLYPTLAELAGLPAPTGPQSIDGISLVPVLRDPAATVRDHAYHVYPKARLGRAIRTSRYRLVEWKSQDDPEEPAVYELYDYQQDPHETRNLAAEQPEIVARLQQTLDRYPEPVGRRAQSRRQPPPKPAQSTSPEVARPLDREAIQAGWKAHDRALHVKSGWIRDPYVVQGPDGWYYLTGTTPNPGDPREQSDPYNTGLGDTSIVGWHAQVWRTRDFIDWESLGTPFSLKDGIWFTERPQRFQATKQDNWFLWAPELHWLGDSDSSIANRWALVHTSPSPVAGANLAISPDSAVAGPWRNPLGAKIGRRHDPSLFRDDDGSWWLIWGATSLQKLAPDFSDFAGAPVRIGPSGESSRMGHEGCLIRRIHDQYVLFGTGWSTGEMRKGSYNLYYATADRLTGPYSERKFAGRFLGHGTPFTDDQGRWWCTAFYNADIPPVARDGIVSRDLSDTAQTINQRGTTLVPLDVRLLDDGELLIRAKDPDYATPGPDEAQQF